MSLVCWLCQHPVSSLHWVRLILTSSLHWDHICILVCSNLNKAGVKMRRVSVPRMSASHLYSNKPEMSQSNPDFQGQRPLPLTHLPFPLTVVFQCAMGALGSMAPIAHVSWASSSTSFDKWVMLPYRWLSDLWNSELRAQFIPVNIFFNLKTHPPIY